MRLVAGAALTAVTGCRGFGRGEALPSPTPLPPTPEPTPTQAAIASPVPGYTDPRKWAGRTVAVASQGGPYQGAQAAAVFEPFSRATGARVLQQGVDLGELRQQVDQESVTWDVADVPTEEVLPLARGHYLTPIDYQVVDRTPLFPEIAMQHGVGAAVFSTVIAYAAGAERPPSGWVDFWDVDSLGGARALRRSPIGTLEFALLADNVPLDRLYPLDVDRAFTSLDRIKPHVAQWYENAMQPVALIIGGDVAMASSFHVLAETDQARPALALEWTGGMLSADSWVVPRGAPNADVAMDLVNFATRAIPSANLSRLVPFGPVNRDAFALLRRDRIEVMPNTEPRRSVQFVQNWNWWADNRAELIERFEEWLLVEPVAPLGEGTPGPR